MAEVGRYPDSFARSLSRGGSSRFARTSLFHATQGKKVFVITQNALFPTVTGTNYPMMFSFSSLCAVTVSKTSGYAESFAINSICTISLTRNIAKGFVFFSSGAPALARNVSKLFSVASACAVTYGDAANFVKSFVANGIASIDFSKTTSIGSGGGRKVLRYIKASLSRMI